MCGWTAGRLGLSGRVYSGIELDSGSVLFFSLLKLNYEAFAVYFYALSFGQKAEFVFVLLFLPIME